jgi:hypothetical protein
LIAEGPEAENMRIWLFFSKSDIFRTGFESSALVTGTQTVTAVFLPYA